jgi:hypothetical protein
MRKSVWYDRMSLNSRRSMFILHKEILFNVNYLTKIYRESTIGIVLESSDHKEYLIFKDTQSRENEWNYLKKCIDNEWELCDLNEEKKNVCL